MNDGNLRVRIVDTVGIVDRASSCLGVGVIATLAFDNHKPFTEAFASSEDTSAFADGSSSEAGTACHTV
jgi:hypothetical protein